MSGGLYIENFRIVIGPYSDTIISINVIIIVEIGYVPAPWLKAVNKHNTTYIINIVIVECYLQFNK